MIVLSFLCLEPIFRVTGFVFAMIAMADIGGIKGLAKGSWWILVMVLVVAAFNSIFNANGLSLLFTIDVLWITAPVSVECIVYGICSGLMLAAVIMWFNAYSRLMSASGFLTILGSAAPTVGLVLARITVFIPEVVNHARHINFANKALEGNTKGGTKNKLTEKASNKTAGKLSNKQPNKQPNRLSYAISLVSQLMEWSMEKSLITADSMRARGYGAAKRSSYRRTRLTARDTAVLAPLIAVGVVAAVLEIIASQSFMFYPYIGGFSPWWFYLPYAMLCAIPFLLSAIELVQWRLSETR